MPFEQEARTLAPLDVARLFVSRRWLVLGATLLFAAGSVGLAVLQPPRFEASATVLLDPSARGGLIGSLSMLSPLGGTVIATSEVAVLRSRDVVESVVRAPAAGRPATPDEDGYDLHVGLTTTVRDESLRVWPLFLAQRKGAVDGRSPVLADARLFAHAELGPAANDDTPRCVRVEFIAPARVRVSTPGRLARLGLGGGQARELAFAPNEPLDYRGLRLVLSPKGDVVGRAFSIAMVADYEAAAALLDRYWAAETTRNSGVIRLTVEDTDPYRAAETANALVANYLDSQRVRRERRSEHTLGYIENLIDESQGALERAQNDLVRLRTEKPQLVDLDTTGAALIEELASLDAQARLLALRERSLGEVLSALRTGDTLALARLDGAVTGGLFVDPTTESYLAKLASLNAEYVELSQVYFDDNPKLAEVRGAADEILAMIAEQIDSRISGLAFQRAEIEGERAGRLGELALLPADMLALAEPMLAVRTQQELLPELLTNLKASEIADSSSAFVAQLLDRARPAVAVSAPKLPAIAAVGAALGLVLGLVVALLREPVAGRIRGRADLEALIPRPLLGTLPVARLADLDGAPALDAIRSLRAAIKNLRAGDAPVRVLGIASVESADVRARISAELARAFAREGARVVLVEGDLKVGGVTGAFGLAGAPGVAEALRRDTGRAAEGAATALSASDTPGLAVLPAGAVDEDACELAGGGAFDRLLAELLAGHDFVLVDLPAAGAPLLEALAPKLDGVLLACAANGTRRHAVKSARARIERAGGTLFGALLLAHEPERVA
jgi:uncharacterized protein involved in exopolysaccharide biosynthesis